MLNLPLLPIHNGLDSADLPLLIAGPCSAESEEQVLTTAKQLKATGRVGFFRAGVWKPRTRPNMFEGVGVVALKWLQAAKEQTGLRTATEVATPEHVEQALKHGVDMLWVGARTSANPFSVQAIADALRGTDVIVLVKNPVNPDLQLWLGALERISGAGIKRLGAIHRGFSSYERSLYRNAPMWSIPIELMSTCPMLPVLCDPSHICGSTELISSVSQKALDFGMNGLMIECHPNPTCAKSDAEQQLTPHAFNQLLGSLKFRSTSSTSASDGGSLLSTLRNEIDALDEELLQKLASRMDVVVKIARYKQENDITILQLNRWSHMLTDRLKQGEKLGLSEVFLKKMLSLIHQESISRQEKVINSQGSKQ